MFLFLMYSLPITDKIAKESRCIYFKKVQDGQAIN